MSDVRGSCAHERPVFCAVAFKVFFFFDEMVLDRRQRLQVLDLSLALCNALEYLHDVAVPGRIVCHRDLKPDNIGFAADGTLKLIDFGLGKVSLRWRSEETRDFSVSLRKWEHFCRASIFFVYVF